MSRREAPGVPWLLGLLASVVLIGGVVAAITEEQEPVIETTIIEREVLPEGQAEVTGRVDGFVADDAVGPVIGMPVELESGGATIDGAIVDGVRSTIVWDGGRPFRLSGTGTIDLGPTHLELGVGALFWSLDGVRILSPGDYRLDTPVAVGTGGLARPVDSVSFRADEETTIETGGGAKVVRGLPVHIEGPGSFRADGAFRVRTRDGTVDATHLEFGPGPFVVDVEADGTITATFNGDLVFS